VWRGGELALFVLEADGAVNEGGDTVDELVERGATIDD